MTQPAIRQTTQNASEKVADTSRRAPERSNPCVKAHGTWVQVEKLAMSESIFRELFVKFIPSSRPRRAVLVSAMAAASFLSPGTASAAPAAQVQTFASPGTHTFTVPQDVSQIRIVALGGGGGGGGGGGNNGDSFSGGGGGGGGSSAVVSCLIPVKSGSKISLTVGSGGVGGTGGSGMDNDGAWGKNGSNTTVDVGGKTLASAEHGWEGPGGDASGFWASGFGTRGGGGGGEAASRCEGTDRTITPGNGGTGGQAGSTNYRGGGGAGGTPPQRPDSCPTAGVGGHGGIGAGSVGASNVGRQASSTPGYEGNEGCVVLTYTTDAGSS
ncbi:hypothetical protein AB0D59_31315 [Streptomyces sp. NPDC048417]|uniref:glycine-rich domain-containing protein n=1 Tax=Streptomyces sp. NPDC048417 TaxID=3155387 RepID=UPI003438F54C